MCGRPRLVDRKRLGTLYSAGLPIADIAREMGVKITTIRVIASKEGLNAGRIAGRGVTFFLSAHERTLLRIEADKRGLRASELAHKLINTILQDDMIDAILDDKESS
jgi:hypothetical protein